MNITDYNWSTDTTTCENLIDAVNWLNLQEYASRLHQDEACNAEPPIGMGGRHFVRILTFKGGDRWLARFPIRSNDTDETVMLQEAGILRIVAEHSTVPVPIVFATVPRKAEFGVAFMLMDCLPGNVGVDVNDGIVPQKYKSRFFKQMANAQVRKLIQNVLRYFILTNSTLGTNVQYRVSAHRDTSQARRWNNKHRTNPWHRRSV
jgi:aminoglycoside phosphotransferase (APT) family kinase protein